MSRKSEKAKNIFSSHVAQSSDCESSNPYKIRLFRWDLVSISSSRDEMAAMLVTMLDVPERNWATSLEICWKDSTISSIAFSLSLRLFTYRLVVSNETWNDFISCMIASWPFCNAARADNTSSGHGFLFYCELSPGFVSTSPAQRIKRNTFKHTRLEKHMTSKKVGHRVGHDTAKNKGPSLLKHSVEKQPTWSKWKRENSISAVV